MSLLFESVNYRKARVRVRKIFANNLLQFFQQNYYGGDYYSDMDYVSRIVRDTTVDLSAKASTKLDLSNTYSLDLSRLITDGRKSMYLLEIKGVEPLVPADEYDYDYYFGDYRTYRERSKLVLQSDIGIICKSSGEEEYVVYTTDLLSARPKRGCKVRAYDKQNQTVAEASTDSEGRAVLKCREEPSIVAAEADGQLAFVKVERGAALSLSNFDVGAPPTPKARRVFCSASAAYGGPETTSSSPSSSRPTIRCRKTIRRPWSSSTPTGSWCRRWSETLLGRHLHVQTRNDAGGAYRTVAGARKSGRRGIRKSDPRGRHQAQPNENRHAAR